MRNKFMRILMGYIFDKFGKTFLPIQEQLHFQSNYFSINRPCNGKNTSGEMSNQSINMCTFKSSRIEEKNRQKKKRKENFPDVLSVPLFRRVFFSSRGVLQALISDVLFFDLPLAVFFVVCLFQACMFSSVPLFRSLFYLGVCFSQRGDK